MNSFSEILALAVNGRRHVGGRLPRLRLFFPLFLVTISASTAAPIVSNVRASQRADGTGMVDIYYNLSGAVGPVVISVAVSIDDGSTFGILPQPSRLSGDVGSGIVNGNDHRIVWDVARDRPEVNWPTAKTRVIATELARRVFTLPHGVVLEMVSIPPGTIMIGNNNDPGWGASDEVPAHNVTIAYPLYLGTYEVTQAQWGALNFSNSSNKGIGDNYPVHNVSYNTVTQFIEQLNTLQLGGTFRLPSEAEWEYGARGGQTTRFWFGNSTCPPTDCVGACDLGAYAWYCNNSSGSTHPVSAPKLPNPFGLYGTMGNVWEWVEDIYHADYNGNPPTDGTPWLLGTPNFRVLRGGSHASPPLTCQSSSRDAMAPGESDNANGSVGFRLAWTP